MRTGSPSAGPGDGTFALCVQLCRAVIPGVPLSVTACALQDVILALQSSLSYASLPKQVCWLLSEGEKQLLLQGSHVFNVFGVFIFALGYLRKPIKYKHKLLSFVCCEGRNMQGLPELLSLCLRRKSLCCHGAPGWEKPAAREVTRNN